MDSATEKSLQKQLSKVKVRAPVRRVRLWTRLSPKHLLRVFVDNYVKGCITFANDSDADNASSFQVTLSYEDEGSRPRGRVASARELDLDLSGSKPAPAQQRLVVAESVHLAHKHGAIITSGNGSSMANLQGQVGASALTTRGADSGVLRITGENNVAVAGRLDTLLQTLALHPTDFLQSASRRGAAPGTPGRLGHLTARGGSGRMLMRRRSGSSTSSVSPVSAMSSSRPLTPVTDMSTFREQSRRRKPSRSTLAVRRPSRDVETPPPTAASPQPFLEAMYITS